MRSPFNQKVMGSNPNIVWHLPEMSLPNARKVGYAADVSRVQLRRTDTEDKRSQQTQLFLYKTILNEVLVWDNDE